MRDTAKQALPNGAQEILIEPQHLPEATTPASHPPNFLPHENQYVLNTIQPRQHQTSDDVVINDMYMERRKKKTERTQRCWKKISPRHLHGPPPAFRSSEPSLLSFGPFLPLNLQTSPESPAKPQIFSRNLQSFALSAACAACHGLSLLSPAPENSESLALFYRSNRSVGRRPRENRRQFSPSSIPPTRTTQPTPSSPRGSQICGVLFSLQWIIRGPFRGTRCESKGPRTVPIVSASATTPSPPTANRITIEPHLPPYTFPSLDFSWVSLVS